MAENQINELYLLRLHLKKLIFNLVAFLRIV